MGIRSKKSRAFLVWLCFFIGVNILIGLAALGVEYADDIYTHFGDIMAIIRWDIKDTDMFKQDIADRYEHLLRVVTGTDFMESYVSSFSNEGDNLIYYAENLVTGKTVGNIDKETVIGEESVANLDGEIHQAWDKVILPSDYDYYLYYNGSGITVQNRNKTVNVYNRQSGYHNTWLSPYLSRSKQYPEIRILLMVKEDIMENPYGFSILNQIRYKAQQARWVCFGVLGVIILDLALLAIALVKRKNKREFDRTLARLSGWLWFEVKVVLSVLVLLFFFQTERGFGFSIGSCVLIFCGLWWFYIMLVDLVTHKKRFFTHNSINWLIGLYRRYESKKPFQKALLRRVYALVSAETILVILAVTFAVSGERVEFMAIPFVAAGIYLLYRYLRRFGKTVNDLDQIMDRVETMRNGKYTTQPYLPPDSDLYRVWEDLTLIQSGIQKAVDEKVRSERMKMELITNVSHDLKTPLTSIISYTDLIAREEGLPDTVKDYVQILSQKSERLKTLIQDLFELSRAASGDMILKMERIDLVRLMEQTLADMNEQIEQSDLTFKVNMSQWPVYILSDGRRLYRVFQNLISNALKYSMKSSRVYVNVASGDNGEAKVEIKNISSYEMDFDSEEIMERFVRGDKARSTEGAGLGLAIARSFTLACGGSFDISIDGDLFKVILSFNRLADEEEDNRVVSRPQDEDCHEKSFRKDEGAAPRPQDKDCHEKSFRKDEGAAPPPQGEEYHDRDGDSVLPLKCGEEDSSPEDTLDVPSAGGEEDPI